MKDFNFTRKEAVRKTKRKIIPAALTGVPVGAKGGPATVLPYLIFLTAALSFYSEAV